MATTNINAIAAADLIGHLEEAALKLRDCAFLFEQIHDNPRERDAAGKFARIGKAIARESSELALDAVEQARERVEA